MDTLKPRTSRCIPLLKAKGGSYPRSFSSTTFFLPKLRAICCRHPSRILTAVCEPNKLESGPSKLVDNSKYVVAYEVEIPQQDGQDGRRDNDFDEEADAPLALGGVRHEREAEYTLVGRVSLFLLRSGLRVIDIYII